MYKHTHVGVYGIVLNNGKILLVKKQRGPYLGMWDLPGGGIEMGENSNETLVRELLEECGYEMSESKLIDVINSRIKYINSKGQLEELTMISIIYNAKLTQYDSINGNSVIRKDEDVSEAQWMSIDNMTKLSLTPIADFLVKWMERSHD
jgi:ADP-ribose pyrophosphatase YjhB (NUDIX family)